MRPIHLVRLDKTRPALILTRATVRPHIGRISVAPITSRVLGLSTEVPVGTPNGLTRPSVVTCDNVVTVPTTDIGRLVGFLLTDQERALATALAVAYDLVLDPAAG